MSDDTGGLLSLGIDDVGRAWLSLEPGAIHVTPRLLRTLDAHLHDIEGLIRDGRVRAVVLHRAKRGLFLAAEDPAELLAIEDAGAAVRMAEDGQRTLRRLEQLSVPTVAAIDGPCLGGGLEIALACSYRVATTPGSSRFALPQLRLGIIPGLGGTVRLPRLIGLQESMRLILAAEIVDAAEAHDLGLIDALFPTAGFRTAVEEFTLDRVERGRLRTGARRRMSRRLFEDTAPGRRLIFSRASRGLIPQLEFPAGALRSALESIADGISLPIERGFRREAELHGELVVSDSARALMHAALLADRSPAEPSAAHPVRRAAVLGSGDRGSELAYLFARTRVAVRLKDRKRSAVTAAVQAVRDRLSDAGAGRRRPTERGQPQGEMIEGAVGFGGFGTLDLVVAAVGHRPQVTRLALAEAERHVTDACLLASASPFVRLAEIESHLRDPSRLLGLVVTSPAELFPVLEIVPGSRTSHEAVAAARHLARRLGHQPIVVADRAGLLVHRLLAAQLAEATRLVDEGLGIREVDAALEDFGFRMGPLSRIDAMGTEATARLLRDLGGVLGEAATPGQSLGRLHERGTRFYRYRNGRAVSPNPDVRGRADSGPASDAETILDRVLLSTVNAAARALEEEVVAGAADVDRAAIYGLGYPRLRGGLLYQSDLGGLSALAARLDVLADRHGERFRPAPLIRELATHDGTFYGRTTGHAGEGVLR